MSKKSESLEKNLILVKINLEKILKLNGILF